MNENLLNEINNIRNMMGLFGEGYKISKDERLVLSDTENFLQVLPLTRMASCKYGSATKWCVSSRNGEGFDYYKDKGWDVSMIMIKNPELVKSLGTGKFAFNIYNNKFLEITDDRDRYMTLEKLSKELGIEGEVKSLIDDYISFMKENRELGEVVNLPFKSDAEVEPLDKPDDDSLDEK